MNSEPLKEFRQAAYNLLVKAKDATFELMDTAQLRGYLKLNNVQLLLVPLLAFNLVKPWLLVFNNPLLVSSFLTLISLVNLCANAFLNRDLTTIYSFSSA
jgi:hypothetical protein